MDTLLFLDLVVMTNSSSLSLCLLCSPVSCGTQGYWLVMHVVSIIEENEKTLFLFPLSVYFIVIEFSAAMTFAPELLNLLKLWPTAMGSLYLLQDFYWGRCACPDFLLGQFFSNNLLFLSKHMYLISPMYWLLET